MKAKLEQIYQNKKKTLDQLVQLNNKYLAVVYKGLVDDKSIREIHKSIRKITTYQVNNDLSVDFRQEKYCDKLTKKVKNQVEKDTSGVGLAVLVYTLFKQYDAYHSMKEIAFDYVRKQESKAKKDILNQEIRENKKLKVFNTSEFNSAKIFYLASSHDDCAEDHEDYQGRLYVDDNWDVIIRDQELREELRKFISSHKIQSFQWVIGRPVWFITRPNCRHYFVKVPVGKAMNESVSELISEYNTHSAVGKKGTQTIRHSTNKSWYNQENVKSIIEKYQERLAYHNSLYAVKPSDILKREIQKDRLLIKKWKDYQAKMG